MGDKKAIGLALAVLLMGAVAISVGLTMARGAAGEEQPVGRFQMAVPDLILDTATGKLVTAGGQTLQPPVDPSGKDVGRYSVDGYVTAVTRYVGLDVLNQPTMGVDVVKGYVLGDTKTGRILKQAIYYSQPIQPGELSMQAGGM